MGIQVLRPIIREYYLRKVEEGKKLLILLFFLIVMKVNIRS